MRTPYFGKNPRDANEKWNARQQATDFIRQRGTAKPPNAPRDAVGQPAPRGIQVTWGLPAGDSSDITGWRIYSPDENTLVGSIGDRGTRIFTVPATAGSSPPSTNVYITAVNTLGAESGRTLTTGKALAESGAPSQPAPPPGFVAGPGSDIGRGTGLIDSGFTVRK